MMGGFLSGIIATFLGVFLAFKLEGWRREKAEKHEFESGLKALDFEMEQNLSIIKKFREEITGKNFFYASLRSTALDLLLLKGTTIKFGGEAFYRSLTFTKTRTNSFTQYYDRLESHAYTSGGLSNGALIKLQDLLNQTEFVIGLTRALIKKYEQQPKSLLQKSVLDNLGKCLELEKLYRVENFPTAYERLKNECRL